MINHLAKQIIFRKLKQLHHGQLTIREVNESITFGNSEKPKATITVKNNNFYSYLLFGGSIGSAESYMNQYWNCDNLTNLIRIFALNENLMDQMEGIFNSALKHIFNFFHWLNKNTISGSEKNIAKHYDLSNDFFSSFLDQTMMYSAGIYYSKKDSLHQAQLNKLCTICETLNLKKTDKVIEIGSGWGGFAIFAAQNYGCHVTTTTISQQQYNYAKNLIKKLKLEKQIKIIKQDYRELKGTFNKLVSIEMIEAVGHHFYDAYFETISRLLQPDGEALIQAITIRDQRYLKALKSVDFIQKYIFPGSCIPSINVMQNSITRKTDLVIHGIKDIGIDYAETLKDWRTRFNQNKETIKNLGFDISFQRMWEFYLCYCEGGFREKVISDIQLHLTKKLFRPV